MMTWKASDAQASTFDVAKPTCQNVDGLRLRMVCLPVMIMIVEAMFEIQDLWGSQLVII